MTEYYLEGSRILGQKNGSNVYWYHYDSDGTRLGMEYAGEVYYYYYNAQGDVLGLFDKTGATVVEYTYDSWGKVISTTGSMANTLGIYNPFRYRGYYYDGETQLYYLNSRYYDPETGRFLNADGVLGANGDMLSYNLFAYCSNNPVSMVDPTGKCAKAWAAGYSGPCPGQGKPGCMDNWPQFSEQSPVVSEPAKLPEIKPNMPKKDFVDAVYARAKANESKTKIPAAILTAQACLESGYGTSAAAVKHNNLFGMMRKGKIRSYDSLEASIISYEKTITGLSCYRGLFNLETTKEWAYAIGPAGYCPDPGYGDAVWGVIQMWDLE